MSITTKPTILALAIPALGAFFSASAWAEDICFTESRSGVNLKPFECSKYHSEISNTRAFLETVVNRGKWTKPNLRPVIIDVRSTSEYKAGHPEHAYNVPYPYIFQYCTGAGRQPDGACVKTDTEQGDQGQLKQDPDFFKSYVEKLIPNKDTPIYTMCRTGVRSVGAANRLQEAGYTNVRNMWEGFVGVNLKAPQYVYWDDDGKPTTPPVKKIPEEITDQPVDLNHDGILNADDLNGWRYHLALPYDTRLLPPLIYKPDAETYYWD